MKGRGSLPSLLRSARAELDGEAPAVRPSLAEPSRPFTPANDSRHMFYGDDYHGSQRPPSRPSSTTWAKQDERRRPRRGSDAKSDDGAHCGSAVFVAQGLVSDDRGHDHESAASHVSPPEKWGWASSAASEKPAAGPSTRRSSLRRSADGSVDTMRSGSGEIDAVASDEVRSATIALSDAWAQLDSGAPFERKQLLEKCDLLWSAVDGLCSCAAVRQRSLALAEAVAGSGATAAPSLTLSQPTLAAVISVVPRLVEESASLSDASFAIRLTMKLVRIVLRLATGVERESLGLFRLAAAAAEDAPRPSSPTHGRDATSGSATQRALARVAEIVAVDDAAATALLDGVVSCAKRLYAASKEDLGDSVACEELLPHALLELLRVAVFAGGRSARSSRRGARRRRSSESDDGRCSIDGGDNGVGGVTVAHGAAPTQWTLPFDAVMYAAAALKNISCCADAQRQLVDHGAVRKLTELLSAHAAPQADEERASSALTMSSRQVAQILVQITATLRNLAKSRRSKSRGGGGKKKSAHGSGSGSSIVERFRAAGTARALLTLVAPFVHHGELMFNVSRVVAHVSLDPTCRKPLLADLAPCRALLRVLSVHYQSHRALTVRVCYILGNLVAAHATARRMVGIELDGIDILGEIMARYIHELGRLRDTDARRKKVASRESNHGEGRERGARRVAENIGGDEEDEDARERKRGQSSGGSSSKLGDACDDAGADVGADAGRAAMSRRSESKERARERTRDEVEDVLVKSARVVANIALDLDAGWSIVSSSVAVQVVELFLHTMDVEHAASEELCLNVVSTLANFSFYDGRAVPPPSSVHDTSSDALNATADSIAAHDDDDGFDSGACALAASRCEIVRCLVPLMVHPNEEMKVEALRALGNFSRAADARAVLAADGGADLWPCKVLAILLDHRRREIVFTTCGVFTNLLADAAIKSKVLWLPIDGGCIALRLLAVVWDAGIDDVEMATVACRALANGFTSHCATPAATGVAVASTKENEGGGVPRSDGGSCVGASSKLSEDAEGCVEDDVDALGGIALKLRRLSEAAADELDEMRLDADGLQRDEQFAREMAELSELADVVDKLLAAVSEQLVASRTRLRAHLVPL